MIDINELVPGFSFKFVAPEWADAVEAGSVRIGTLVDYMIMEGPRRDPLEGQVVRRPSRVFKFGPESSAAEIAAFEAKSGMHIGANRTGTATIHAGQFISYTSGYCFCTSRRPAAAPKEDHVVFKINMVKFGRAVTKAYEDKLGIDMISGSVRYLPRVGDFDDDTLVGLDPFAKDPRFQQEDEYRFFWPNPPRRAENAATILDSMRQGLYAFNTEPNLEIAASIERL